MREDIEVEVVHDAPVLLRNRRGPAPLQAVARQTARGRLRHVPPDALAERPELTGEHARINGGLALFEGRLWRGVCGVRPWGTNRKESGNTPVAAVVEALASPPVAGIREDLAQLSLTPWNVHNQYGRCGNHARVLDGATLDPGKLALDLRAEASAAIARRVSTDLLHDGKSVWIAVPTPLLRLEGGPVAAIVEAPVTNRMDFAPRTLAEQAESHLAYMGTWSKVTRPGADRFLAVAESLSRELSGLEATPLADMRRDLRRQAILTYHACESLLQANRDREAASLDWQALGLIPLVARASADLLEEPDFAAVADRIAACASRTMAANERLANASHGMHALRRVVAYVDSVARPRLASGNIPEADAESLDTLAF